MRINNFDYLAEPIDVRGAKSLYEKLVPIKKEFFFIVIDPDYVNKEKPSTLDTPDLYLPDNVAATVDKIKRKNHEVLVLATGPDCEVVQVGDKILPAAGLFQTAQDVEFKDGARFFIGKEHYVQGIFNT